jgi:hypothetical protein
MDNAYLRWLGTIPVVLLAAFAGLAQEPVRELPPLRELVRRVADNAQASERKGLRGGYSFVRLNIAEELDDSGRVRERKEKKYLVEPVEGRSFSRLTHVDGKPLAGRDLKQEQEREAKWRSQAAVRKKPQNDNDKKRALDRDLAERYDYTIAGREIVNGRPTVILEFRPKTNLQNRTIEDRVINNLSGKVWIDEQEFEWVRLDVQLQNRLSFFAGLAGSLQKFVLILERTRLEDGTWMTSTSRGEFQGRQFVSSKHLRFSESATGFKKPEPEPAAKR